MTNPSVRVRSAIAALLFGLVAALAGPATAQAAPLNCAGADAPPACGGLPTAPPVVLRSPLFEPATGISYLRVVISVDPARMAGYTEGSVHARLECFNGFTQSLYLNVSADRRTLASGTRDEAFASPVRCTVVTDSWAGLNLTSSAVSSQVARSGYELWEVSFS